MEALSAVIFCLLMVTTSSLIGFNCGLPSTNITAVSLSSVQHCPGLEETPRERQGVFQLVQERTMSSAPYFACLVERSIMISHCGMHHHSSVVENGFHVGEIMHLTREACRTLQIHGTYLTRVAREISGIKPNTTSTHVVTENGFQDGSRCIGAHAKIGGRQYRDVIVQASYKITLTSGYATVTLDDSHIVLPSAARYQVRDQKAFDVEVGYAYWDLPEDLARCLTTSYMVLYEGVGTIFSQANGQEVLVVNTTQSVLALGLKEPMNLCYRDAYKTEHNKLFLIEQSTRGLPFYFQQRPIDPKEVDMALYVNSKIVYLEKHLSGELIKMYQYFSHRMCEIQHQLLTQLISLAFLAPDEFAWAYTRQPGVTAILRGEVIYIMQCPPISVDYRPINKCFQEMPVRYNGTDMFLRPRTRQLVRYGTEIDCNPLAPVKYRTNTGWAQFTPAYAEAIAPSELSASPETLWTYATPTNLLSAGIYSESTLQGYQRKLLFPLERAAIQNILVKGVVSNNIDYQGIDASRLLGPDAVDRLQTRYWKKIYGWWWAFSVHLSGFTGFIILLMVMKGIANMAVNGTLLYKTFGLSFKLLAALWGTLAKHLIMFSMTEKQRQQINTDNDVEEEEMTLYPRVVVGAKKDFSSPSN